MWSRGWRRFPRLLPGPAYDNPRDAANHAVKDGRDYAREEFLHPDAYG
jgi:hypothetical protein